MQLPIIILNYNSSADCAKCISFLQRQEEVEVEIVVVDNNSSSADLDALRNICTAGHCTLIESRENRGYNAGNNIGLRYAAARGYRYALIANPDMEFPDTLYLATLLATINAHPDTVVVGSDIVGVNGQHQSPMGRDGNWRGSFGWLKFIVRPSTRKPAAQTEASYIDNPHTSHYCHKVAGSCLLVDLRFIQSIGFFDENVFLYVEEAILSRQVEQAGKRMYYTAQTQALHRHISSAKGNPIRRFEIWRQSRNYFTRHYSGDHWLGRQLSILSMNLYVAVFIINYRLRHRKKQTTIAIV